MSMPPVDPSSQRPRPPHVERSASRAPAGPAPSAGTVQPGSRISQPLELLPPLPDDPVHRAAAAAQQAYANLGASPFGRPPPSTGANLDTEA